MVDSSDVVSPERIAALLAYGILDTPPEPAFDDVVRLAQRLCGTPIALVSLVTGDRQWFKARAGIDATETPLNQSVCAHGVAEHSDLNIPDLTLDARTRDNPLVTGPSPLRFYAGALLEAPDGAALGMLCVIDHAPRPHGLSAEQMADLAALGRQVVLLLELRRAVRERDAGLQRASALQQEVAARALASEAVGEELRAAVAQIAMAQQAGGTGLFDIDLQSATVRVSPELCRLFGRPVAEVIAVADLAAMVVAEDRHVLVVPAKPAGGSGEAEYRIRRADDGAVRWIARRGAFVGDAGGRPARFVGTLHDVTARKLVVARQAALLALGDRLRDAATTTEIVDVACRLLGETLAVAQAGFATIDLAAETFKVERGWSTAGVAATGGVYPLTMFEATIARLVTGDTVIAADVRASGCLTADLASYQAIGTRSLIEVPLLERGRLAGVLFVHGEAPRAWSSEEVAFVQAVADRSHAAIAKVAAEQHQQLLNLELSHRLKNTLAMVQAMAVQTLKGAAERPALDAFSERLMALGRAHDVLLQRAWVGARLHAVARGVLGMHGDRIAIDGPDIELGARGALSVSMLLHELATNAVKYGALSVPEGRVALRWALAHGGSEPELSMTWQEQGGPQVAVPTRTGFGSRLIKAGLAGTGNVSLAYERSGFLGTFKARLMQLTETER